MAEKKFSDLTAKGAALADTDLLAISEDAGGGAYTSKSVTGANVKALVTDANLTTTDITTNDVSTSKHGFAPKAPNDTTKFLRGDATWAVVPAGGLTKFTEAEATTSPNNTVYVDSLTAAGSTTNVDVAIVPKGTGALMANIPDGTTTGGNKRGQYAVDWQHGPKANQDRVASSDYSTIIGGRDNRAYNTYAIAGGYLAFAGGSQSTALQQGAATNTLAFAHGSRAVASGYGSVVFGSWIYADTTASGDNSIAMGGGNIASSSTSTAIGGEGNVSSAQGALSIGGTNNTASGIFSYASGAYSTTNGVQGRQSRGRALGTIQGETQKSEFYLSKRTTDATATTLTVAGGVASTANQVILSNNSAYRFKGTIIGKQSGSTNVAAWDVDGLIVRGANAAATTLVVGNVNLVSNTPAWGTPTLAADTTNGGLRVQVTGLAATNIQWTAVIETTEVIYA
jgi:hypothetical protein